MQDGGSDQATDCRCDAGYMCQVASPARDFTIAPVILHGTVPRVAVTTGVS